jgi:NADH:ubiquinone oxidoreductase subunit 4 (subunit M)
VLLKTDWFAIVIATLGVGVVVYHGWEARHKDPIMKRIVYGLLALIALLWAMCVALLLSTNG